MKAMLCALLLVATAASAEPVIKKLECGSRPDGTMSLETFHPGVGRYQSKVKFEKSLIVSIQGHLEKSPYYGSVDSSTNYSSYPDYGSHRSYGSHRGWSSLPYASHAYGSYRAASSERYPQYSSHRTYASQSHEPQYASHSSYQSYVDYSSYRSTSSYPNYSSFPSNSSFSVSIGRDHRVTGVTVQGMKRPLKAEEKADLSHDVMNLAEEANACCSQGEPARTRCLELYNSSETSKSVLKAKSSSGVH